MILIRSGVVVIWLPRILWWFLSHLPGWRATSIAAETAIASHSHGSVAVYFTKNVRLLRLSTGSLTLPTSSIAIFQPGTEHGWADRRRPYDTAVVGHFHRGHGDHALIDTQRVDTRGP